MTRLLLLSVLAASLLTAQDWARATVEKSPRHREWVTVKHDGRSVETFVVYPESKDKTPVVVIIHEIFGMTDWVQDLADQFAAAGYIAVAPDLLSGMAPNGGRTHDFPRGGVGPAIGKLNPDQITADLNAVADYGMHLPARPTASCSSPDFAGAAARLSGSPRIARIWQRRSSFTAVRPRRKIWSGFNAPVYGFYAEQRRAHRRHHSRHRSRDESRGQDL